MRGLMLLLFSALPFTTFSQIAITAPDSVTDKPWSFETSLFYYSFPHEEDVFTPILYLDYNALHFELRYNYEDRKTASFFGGYRFETGGKVELGITPIVGFVTGNTKGVAPGLEIDIVFNKFDFYSESEWLFDLDDKENNFIYTWSEVAFSPNESIRTGISANRTKIYDTKREIQHGVFAQYSFNTVTAGMHYFNPFSDYFMIFTLSIAI